MSESVVNSAGEQIVEVMQLSVDEQQDILSQARDEHKAVVHYAKKSNTTAAVNQYFAGMHSLNYINLITKVKSRSVATDTLDNDLRLWLSADTNRVVATYAAIKLLHGDLEVKKELSKEEKQAVHDRIKTLPPVSHFHQAYKQLVERTVNNGVEVWVLLPGYEKECQAHYDDMRSKLYKITDTKQNDKIVEKGIATRTNELIKSYMDMIAGTKSAEAAQLRKAEAATISEATKVEDALPNLNKIAMDKLAAANAAVTDEDKARLATEAMEASKVLNDYRKNMTNLTQRAAELASQAKRAENASAEATEKAEKVDKKVTKKLNGSLDTADVDKGHGLPWQAQAENAAAKASVKDLADTLVHIIAKHDSPDDVVYEIIKLHMNDCSIPFKRAAMAFRTRWEEPKTATV